MSRVKQCALLATLLLLVASFQVIYGATFCHNEADYCITVTTENDNMKFQLNATSEVGWVGVGIGTGMRGSYLVLAWPSADGVAISHRQTDQWAVPTVQGDQVEADAATSGIRNGRFIVEFQRPFDVQGSTVSINTTDFVYAYCNTRPSETASNDTTDLQQHDYRGTIKLDLKTGESSESEDPNRRKFVAHGVLMFLSWAFTMPLAAAIARFGRSVLPKAWFRLHVGIQLFLTTPLVIAGFVVGYYAKDKEFDSSVAHQLFGVILVAALGVQIVLGVIHHELFDPNRQHIPWWTKVHWWWGRLIFVAALVQIPLGLRLYKKTYKMSYALFVVYYVYIALLVAAFVLGSILMGRRKAETAAKPQNDQVPYHGVLLNSNEA